MTIAITRTDLDARGLRAAAARAKDAAAARRILALALVLEGQNRTEAAESAGIDRQPLRDWVHRYNTQGLQGLTNRPNHGGPMRKLTAAQESEVADWIRAGPTWQVHKVVCWRCCDLRDEIARHFGVKMHERTVGKLLTRLNFSRVSVRPSPCRISRPSRRIKNFVALARPIIPEHARDKPIELWKRASASRAA